MWWSSVRASPAWPPPPDLSNAVSPSRFSSASPTSAAGWPGGPNVESGPLAGTEVANNRGFHAFFRQYYNLRELLRRSDPGLSQLRPVEDYPLVDGEGRRDTFRGLPQTPPWNAIVFALRSPTFRFRDLVRIDGKAAAPLATVSVPGIYEQLDDPDADTFLDQINFPIAARHLAFEVFARSFFARPERLSAAELAAMFHIYFLGSNEGLVFDVAASNFDTALWNPLGEYLTGRGVRFHTGVSADSISTDGPKRMRVTADDGRVIDADGVVLAVDVGGLQQIVAASPGLGDEDWRRRVAEMQVAPPFVVQRLWLDAPVDADRPPFLGTGGLEPVDNISVVSNYERQAARVGTRRTAGRWSRCTPTRLVDSVIWLSGPSRRSAGEDAGAPAPVLPGDRTRRHRGGTDSVQAGLPAVLAGFLRAASDRGHTDVPGWCSPVTESASTCR